MESLGQGLKRSREAKGLTLEEVAKMTKISERYLSLIEQDLYEELPSLTYVKGFVKLYAQTVGFDVPTAVELFQKLTVKETKQVLILEGEKLNTPDYAQIALKILKTAWDFSLKHIKRVQPKVWMGIGGFFLFVMILMQIFKSGPPKDVSLSNTVAETQRPSDTVIQPGKVVQKTIAPIHEQPLTVVTQAPPVVSNQPGDGLVLEGDVKDTVWLRVHCDQQLVFEGILKKGAHETWQAKQSFKLRVGNADVIKFTLNGKELGRIGTPGKIKDIRVTKDGWYVGN
jgi:transcriptional regulator with XRE-family HTH domain